MATISELNMCGEDRNKPRLTHEEITELERRLCEWQSPQAMSDLVDHTMTRTGSKNLFLQGGLAFLRDAWIASEFGQIRNAKRVRLVADPWPDFELEISARIERFEAVEADDPQRRRGDEYRDSDGEIEDDPLEDWIARADQAPGWLEAACGKKANKRYSSRANLVIYLNLSEYGIHQSEVEGSFPTATAAVKDSFDAVWVLWKKRAYSIWKGGKLVH